MKDERPFNYNIPGNILLDEKLNGTDLRVYAIVRSFMDTTGKAFFSNEWIASQIHVHKNHIPRSITKLVSRNHLARTEIDGQRYLSIAIKPILEPVDNPGKTRVKKTPPLNKNVNPPLNKNVNQLDHSNIRSKNINNTEQTTIVDNSKNDTDKTIKRRLVTLVALGIIKTKDIDRLISEITYHIQHRKPEITETHALNQAIKLIRDGKWSTPLGMKAAAKKSTVPSVDETNGGAIKDIDDNMRECAKQRENRKQAKLSINQLVSKMKL